MRVMGAPAVPTYAEILRDTYGASEIYPLTNIQSGTNIPAFISSAHDGMLTLDSGILQNTPGPVTGTLAPLLDGSTGLWNIVNESIVWNGAIGGIFIYGKVRAASVWSDGISRYLMSVQANANNRVLVYKLSGSSAIQCYISIGGVTKTVNISTTTTDWFCLGITWKDSNNGNEVKVYFNGSQVGATQTGFGAWSGAPTITRLGGISEDVNVWDGWLSYRFSKFGSVWSPTDVTNIYIARLGAGPDTSLALPPAAPSVVNADTFVIAGQSNASGRGIAYSNHYSAGVFGNDYQYRILSDPTDSEINQVDAVSMEVTTLSSGSIWAFVSRAMMPVTGRVAYFIPCAKGGTSITAWLPGANHQDRTTLYGSMVYRALQAQADGGVLRCVLMWEGETDVIAGMTQTTFNGHLDTIANAIMTDLGVPVMWCKLHQLLSYNVSTINAAITEAWGDNTNVLTGPDLSTLISDNTDGLGVHLMIPTNLRDAGTLWWNAIKTAFGW